ncbi:MAG: hypothetical protein ACYDAN_01870 [Candidatus Limnocylindrales bacterium]
MTKTYGGNGFLKERAARDAANRGHSKMAKDGYRVHSTAVGNSKGTFSRWQRYEIVVTYELIEGAKS